MDTPMPWVDDAAATTVGSAGPTGGSGGIGSDLGASSGLGGGSGGACFSELGPSSFPGHLHSQRPQDSAAAASAIAACLSSGSNLQSLAANNATASQWSPAPNDRSHGAVSGTAVAAASNPSSRKRRKGNVIGSPQQSYENSTGTVYTVGVSSAAVGGTVVNAAGRKRAGAGTRGRSSGASSAAPHASDFYTTGASSKSVAASGSITNSGTASATSDEEHASAVSTDSYLEPFASTYNQHLYLPIAECWKEADTSFSGLSAEDLEHLDEVYRATHTGAIGFLNRYQSLLQGSNPVVAAPDAGMSSKCIPGNIHDVFREIVRSAICPPPMRYVNDMENQFDIYMNAMNIEMSRAGGVDDSLHEPMLEVYEDRGPHAHAANAGAHARWLVDTTDFPSPWSMCIGAVGPSEGSPRANGSQCSTRFLGPSKNGSEHSLGNGSPAAATYAPDSADLRHTSQGGFAPIAAPHAALTEADAEMLLVNHVLLLQEQNLQAWERAYEVLESSGAGRLFPVNGTCSAETTAKPKKGKLRIASGDAVSLTSRRSPRAFAIPNSSSNIYEENGPIGLPHKPLANREKDRFPNPAAVSTDALPVRLGKRKRMYLEVWDDEDFLQRTKQEHLFTDDFLPLEGMHPLGMSMNMYAVVVCVVTVLTLLLSSAYIFTSDWNTLLPYNSESHDGFYREWLYRASDRKYMPNKPYQLKYKENKNVSFQPPQPTLQLHNPDPSKRLSRTSMSGVGKKTLPTASLAHHSVNAKAIAPPVPTALHHPACWGLHSRSLEVHLNQNKHTRGVAAIADIQKPYESVHPAAFTARTVLPPGAYISDEVDDSDVFNLELSRCTRALQVQDMYNFMQITPLLDLATKASKVRLLRERRECLEASLYSCYKSLASTERAISAYPLRDALAGQNEVERGETDKHAQDDRIKGHQADEPAAADLNLCTPQKLLFSSKYAFRPRSDPSCAAVKPQPLLGACLEAHVRWGSFVSQLKKGSAVEMFSSHGMWAPAIVTGIRIDGNLLRQVKIQFSDSFPGDCEWICVEDCRLAPPRTHVRPAGSGKLGPRPRVGSETSATLASDFKGQSIQALSGKSSSGSRKSSKAHSTSSPTML